MITNLTQPSLNCKALVNALSQVYGDNLSYNKCDPATYIHLLAQVSNPKITKSEALRSCRSLQRHLSYSFIVIDEPVAVYSLIGSSPVMIALEEETNNARYLFSVLSGTLADWHDSILYCTGPLGSMNPNLAKLGEELLAFFDSIGLSSIFSGYNRFRDNQGTLLLERK